MPTFSYRALQADGKGKIISSPRVITADKVEATIEQGTEIPYQQATSSGATSVSFRKANLALKVKPQITPDGNIIMTLDVNKDEPGAVTPILKPLRSLNDLTCAAFSLRRLAICESRCRRSKVI